MAIYRHAESPKLKARVEQFLIEEVQIPAALLGQLAALVAPAQKPVAPAEPVCLPSV